MADGRAALPEALAALEGGEARGKGRWHEQFNTYDDRANLIRTDYFQRGRRTHHRFQGYASVEHDYDELDRVIETRYLGPDGQLIKMLGGYAKITFEYYGSTDVVHYPVTSAPTVCGP